MNTRHPAAYAWHWHLLQVIVVLVATQASVAEQPIDVGHERQVFLDGRFVAKSRGVELVVNRPRITGEKLIVCDKPWEQFYAGGYMSVLQEGDLLRMWYECGDQNGFGGVAYAYSDDGGATWHKPSLGIIDYEGSTDNNLVNEGLHGSTVFHLQPDYPEGYRYGMFIGNPNSLYISKDGYRWEKFGDEPYLDLSKITNTSRMNTFHLDSQNVMFWDDDKHKYVIYPRLNLKPSQTLDDSFGRTFGYAESDTLEGFTLPSIVFQRDDKDPPNLDFYTSAAVKYPYATDAYYMFPAAYYHLPSPPHPRNDGPLDLQFAASRDGQGWTRPDRRPIVRQGFDGQWNSGAHYAGYGMTRHGDELSIYFVAQDITHAEYKKRGYIRGTITRAIYRLDGFMSLDVSYQGGEVTTPMIVHEGDELVLNADCSAGGWIKVVLLDESGIPIEGFSGEDCDIVEGNAVDLVVKWGGQPDASATAGRPIRMQFIMRDTKLYGFHWRSLQAN